MLTGTYLPGRTAVHRAPIGLKFILLAAYTTVLLVNRSPAAQAALTAVVVLGYAVARFGPRVLLAQVAPLRWILLVLVPFQVWTGGWREAALTTGSLVLAVAAASLVTLSTRINDMLDSMVEGLGLLRRFGVDPERVGLLLALAIRAIPVLADLLRQSREARAARGMERSLRALLTPVLNRSIRHAQGVGEALMARGVDD